MEPSAGNTSAPYTVVSDIAASVDVPYENPLTPQTPFAAIAGGMVICCFLLVVGALNCFGVISVFGGGHRSGHRMDELDYFTFGPFAIVGVLVVLGSAGESWSHRRMVKYGHVIMARVTRAATQFDTRMVAITFTQDGKTRKTKVNLRGAWAESIQAGESLDMLVLKGPFGGRHILGRTQVHPLLRE